MKMRGVDTDIRQAVEHIEEFIRSNGSASWRDIRLGLQLSMTSSERYQVQRWLRHNFILYHRERRQWFAELDREELFELQTQYLNQIRVDGITEGLRERQAQLQVRDEAEVEAPEQKTLSIEQRMARIERALANTFRGGAEDDKSVHEILDALAEAHSEQMAELE